MRSPVILVAVWVSFASLAAADEELVQARRLLWSGKYAEATELYSTLLGKPGGAAPQRAAAAVGLARARAEVGRYEEAIKTLRAAGEHADVQAELARLAFQRGDYAAARKQAEAALQANPDQLLGRWIRAELNRTAGKLDAADRDCKGLVDYYNAHDVKDPESLRWIGLAAAQYARWNRLSDQFSFLVHDLYPDAVQWEPAYWPAHFEAGLLFLEKYNRADAAKEFKAALELNPNAAEVHAAMARLAIEHRDVEQAEASLRRAMEINPNLLDAWLLKADLVWANFQPEEAQTLLEKNVLPLNPVSEQTLGRLAACFAIRLERGPLVRPGDGPGKPSHGADGKTRFDRLVREATARNEHAGEFFVALASWLEDRHRFEEAEKFYREAVRRMPKLIGPVTQLGLIAMQNGREAEAKKVFGEAFKADPFNVRVNNSLEVLELLERFETVENPQVVIKFDRQDRKLAQCAARYIERTYPQLCAQFGYRPPQKPLVEIFNEADGASGHQWFSTRMTGLPYLDTVAASTGHIVAMASPNDSHRGSRFNWARVLKHELVHVITLQQTDFNMPHWYTEGLAVWSEDRPRPQIWNELLVQRVPAGKLFDLGSLNLAFARPQSSEDWQMAYCQAELYVEYMLDGRTPEVLKRLTAAYAENLPTRQAVEQTFGVPLGEFERGYVKHLQKVVSPLTGFEPYRTANFTELIKAQQSHPEDPHRAAELAYVYLQKGANQEARDLAQRAIQLSGKDSLAAYVIARILVREGKTDQATTLLEQALDLKRPDLQLLNLLAGLKLKAGNQAQAEALYRLGAERDTYHLHWTRSLARIYLETKQDARLAESLARVAKADPDDFAVRKKLAELAMGVKDYAGAEQWANQAMEIDVTDAEIQALAEKLEKAKKGG